MATCMIGLVVYLVLITWWPRVTGVLTVCCMGYVVCQEAVRGSALGVICILMFAPCLGILAFTDPPMLTRRREA